MLVGIVALSGIFGFAVAGISLLFGGSLLTALWLYPVAGITCTLTISLGRYVCATMKGRNDNRHEYSQQ